MAFVVSVCLHGVFIGQMSGGTEPARNIKTTLPAPPSIIVTLLPSPTPLKATEPAPSATEAALPFRAEQPVSPERKHPPARRASPPSKAPSAQPLTEPSVIGATQAPSAITPTPTPAAPQPTPLTLALPKHPSGNATFGTSDTRDSANELRQQIRSRIEAERFQKSAQNAESNDAPTRVVEWVNADGSRSARVDSNWGSYCLNTPRHHVHGDPRMPANTVVPTTCP